MSFTDVKDILGGAGGSGGKDGAGGGGKKKREVRFGECVYMKSTCAERVYVSVYRGERGASLWVGGDGGGNTHICVCECVCVWFNVKKCGY